MRTSSLGRREQEVQEQRKKGRAGASAARSSVKHCKQSKRYKSNGEEREQEHEHRAEQQRKTSKSIHSCKLARLDDRVWALARALRARARPASRWEHLVSLLCFFYKNVGVCLDEFVDFSRFRLALCCRMFKSLSFLQSFRALEKGRERKRDREREKERERTRENEREREKEREKDRTR